MKQRTIIDGVIIAAGLALVAFIADTFLSILFGTRIALGALVVTAVVTTAAVAPPRGGRATIGLLATGLLAWATFSLSIRMVLILGVAAVWAVRSVMRYRSIVLAMVDLGGTVLGAMFAGWILSYTGSLAGAVWGFFLLQAPLALIPRSMSGEESPAQSEGGKFESAYSSAESLLRQLAAHTAGPCAR